MKPVLEGLLFLMGDDGITYDEIKQILSINDEQLSNLIDELQKDYEDTSRGITLNKYGDIYKLTTKKEYKNYYEKLQEITMMRTLSTSALETLAIIAYKQPITRIEIDELRGINSTQMLRNLMARDLIKEVGRSNNVGHPILYGVTSSFLDHFGLKSLEELPTPQPIKENEDNQDLYETKYKEENY